MTHPAPTGDPTPFDAAMREYAEACYHHDADAMRAGYVKLRDLFAAQSAPRVALTEESPAARDVMAERRRQVEVEGWTPEHDDEHDASELALAAACYAMTAGGYAKGQTPPIWPWSLEWWKPAYGRRDLVRAGALILAEIERLDRITPPAGIGTGSTTP